VAQVADIAKQIGIYDLKQCTPTVSRAVAAAVMSAALEYLRGYPSVLTGLDSCSPAVV